MPALSDWTRNAHKLYTARDEIGFLRGTALSQPAACRDYCRLILRGGREYDASVDVPAVRAEASRLLAVLPSA